MSIFPQPVKDKLLHRLAADQVFGDDAVEQCFVDMVIPDAIGVNYEQGTVVANTETGSQPTFNAQRVVVAA